MTVRFGIVGAGEPKTRVVKLTTALDDTLLELADDGKAPRSQAVLTRDPSTNSYKLAIEVRSELKAFGLRGGTPDCSG